MTAPRTFLEKFIVWLAEGFGIGRAPYAPGTFGTLIGFPWIGLLMLTRSEILYAAGLAAGFFAAVWIGGRAERITGLHDPGRFVIDEIVAMPLVFLPVMLAGDAPPTFQSLLNVQRGWVFGLAFALFRIFDISKPFPAGISQKLPCGWGLVIDDMIAAAYAALLLWAAILLVPVF